MRGGNLTTQKKKKIKTRGREPEVSMGKISVTWIKIYNPVSIHVTGKCFSLPRLQLKTSRKAFCKPQMHR